MSDLKLASDGATRRYDLLCGLDVLHYTRSFKFLAWLGEYDLCWDGNNNCYTVVRRWPAKIGVCYNFTDYHIKGYNLEPTDDDVVLDPYHMGLLYQAHEHFGYEA